MCEYARLLARYERVSMMALTHFNLTQEDPENLVRLARETLPRNIDVVKTTPGMEIRFDSCGNDRVPQVIRFAERLKKRQPIAYPSREEIACCCRERGIPLTWRVLGPFDNERSPDGDYVGLSRDHSVALHPDFSAVYDGKDGTLITWRQVSLEDFGFPNFDGRIDLGKIVGGDECLAYAYAEFEILADGEYEALFSSDDGMKLWIDEIEIFSLNVSKGANPDEFRSKLQMAKGIHRALIAVEQRFAGWMFYFRIIK